jgi:formylglycine-generating enzyme required for sulfatase activity
MRAALRVTLAAGTIAAIGGVTMLALRERGDPARCGAGLVPKRSRCCAPGQSEVGGQCRGAPTACPPAMVKRTNGCVVTPSTIRVQGGTVRIGPEDWEAQGLVEPRTISVQPFRLDRVEVTSERWRECSTRGSCRRADASEPGLPITNVSATEADEFCRFAGGRLPTGEEWLFAAMGSSGRRFPWGNTGLVCRRAAFGLVSGPCAEGAANPELAGSRSDGATPEGVLDLAGNVAEWTREAADNAVARGGSFRADVARELKSWASRRVAARADDVGFRCAYDVADH